MREALSPSGNHKLLVDEKTETFRVQIRKADGWTEVASGKLPTQVGCSHYRAYIADGGTHFAVWKIPYNREVDKNTPLAVFYGNGTHHRTFGLFEVFDREFLAPEILEARGLA